MYLYQLQGNRKKSKKPLYWIMTFLVAFSGAYLTQIYLADIWGIENDLVEGERLEQEVPYRTSTSLDKPSLIEKVMQSVVGISKLQANEESIFDISLSKKWGLGTGIIVSEDGYILTNQHLAGNVGTRLIVNLENGESVQGKVVWAQQDIDVAIVKIEKQNLSVALLGDSDNLRIGEEVWAIGNPLGVEFQRTTTKGIISGINRTLAFQENGKTIFMEDLIQTDASINAGNSGGPLINERGEVIGINTVKISSAEGIGFAIPINIVEPVIQSFAQNHSFQEANLGVYAYDKEVIRYVNTKINMTNGIYVTSVNRGSSAERAGIRVGDILVSIDGIVLNKMMDLRRYIYMKKIGDEVTLMVQRNNRIEKVNVTL